MRPNSQRAKNAISALIAVMIGMVITSIASYLLLYMIADSYQNATDFVTAQNTVLRYTMIVGIIALIQLGVYITCVVLFIMWFRRAYFNLHKLVPKSRLKYTEGMAAGAWFIPIFNLFGPYQIATDLFYESEKLLVENGLMEKQPKFHQIKGWWWGLWIASGVFERISSYIEEGPAEYTISMSFGLISLVMSIGAGILAIQMIKNYTQMEELLKKIDLDDQVSVPLMTNDDLLDSGI